MSDVVLGKICGVFGIKGWLKVRSYTEHADNIFRYSGWRLLLPSTEVKKDIKLEDWRPQGRGLIVKIAGVSDRSAAEFYVGASICVDPECLPALDEGVFYQYQLEGLKVINLQQKFLGEVCKVLETGANDVLVVKPCRESIDSRERMIPYLPEHTVIKVQLESQKISVDWPEDY